MRNKLFRGIFTATMTIFVLSLIIFITLFYIQLDRQHRGELEAEAAFLAAALEENGTEFLTVHALKDPSLSRITLLTKQGEILLSVGGGAEITPRQCQLIIPAALSGSEELKTDIFTAHRLVILQNDTILCVSGQSTPILTLIVEMLLPFAVILVVAILLSLFLASALSAQLTAPIVRIDPDNPDERDVYVELLPFLDKLRDQNNRVRKQIEQIRVEHEKQDSMRREFTANVSHELKTPLTSISGTAEIIRSGLVTPEDIPHFADNIHKESMRLIELVNDILELSRLDDNAVMTVPEPVELLTLSEDILSTLSLPAKHKALSVHLKGEPCVVIGHRKILHEIIYNLCDNAIKYNRIGGSITISVLSSDNNIRVSVSDTGIGIPSDQIDRVFERFYRIDKSHSKDIGGTGLGLSIVKHGAKIHGAKIEIESKLGKGTTITLVFTKP